MTSPTDGCADPGPLRPVIDRDRCGAKAVCVAVCPYQVFDVRRLDAGERRGIGLRGRLKLIVHRGRQAVTPRLDSCLACGKCVAACPEEAIRLV
ncbi:MAG TPA: 4Fe-4S dicluster domain-containing protein [Planctomycetota bacterium]|nr:4Fe-4S dicluster domain-containing protein [Planctomycetota bacterium]